MKFSLRHLHYAICLHGDLWIPTVVRWHVLHSLIIENHCKSMCVHSGDGWALNFNASVRFWPADTWVTSVFFIVLLVLLFESRHFTNLELQKYQCYGLFYVTEASSKQRHYQYESVFIRAIQLHTVYTQLCCFDMELELENSSPPTFAKSLAQTQTWKEKDARSLKMRWEEPDTTL